MGGHRHSLRDALVSVVLPVRNGGAYLADAVTSILAQSHRNLELLLVDDHSDDGAVEDLDICDPRLRVLTSPRNGVAAAFNHGLARAEGEFVARMDADDLALPRRLEAQLGLFSSDHSIDICGTGVAFFPQSAVAGGNRHYQAWLNRLTSPQDLRLQIFIESPIPNPTAMFRRDAIDQLGGYRDPEWPEDYDLYLRADQAGMKLAKTGGVYLRWREHDRRLTRTDVRYSRSRFQQAKAHYLAAGRLPERPFLIWGGGPSGAEMFDLLLDCGRAAEGFLDVHPRRIGGNKRGLPVYHVDEALGGHDHFILVAVGARNVRGEIRQFLEHGRRREGQDFLFVA